MAQAAMSGKSSQGYEFADSDLNLPMHRVNPAFVPDVDTAKPRLLRGLAVALLVLVPVCFCLHSLSHKYPKYLQEVQGHSSWGSDLLGLRHGADGHVGCHHGEAHHNSTLTIPSATLARRDERNDYTFLIPVTSEKYQFVSWGQIDKSDIRIIPYQSNSEQIKVDVQVVRDLKGAARVFKLPMNEQEQTNGVGFYSSIKGFGRPEDRPVFSVTVQLPISSPQQPRRRLNSFETRLAQFDHHFEDLAKYFAFSRLYTSTTSGRLDFDKTAAENMIADTTSGPIKLDWVIAKYVRISSTSGSLQLDRVSATKMRAGSTSGRVKLGGIWTVDAQIETTSGGVSGQARSNKKLSIETTSGRIEGEYSLTQNGIVELSSTSGKIFSDIRLPSDQDPARSKYRVTASNTSGSIKLRVLELAAGSTCDVSASSNSAVRVEMPATFEGKFKFNTRRNQGRVLVEGKRDPSGGERERFVKYDKPGSTASGWTGWGNEGDGRSRMFGEVTIDTMRGPAELVLN